MYLSWIIPAYNEEKRIEKTIRDVHAYLEGKRFPGGYEILVSNSASRDGTLTVVERLQHEIPALRFISLENRGKGWAVKNGMREARGDIRLFADADNSVSPDQADRLLAHICDGTPKSDCYDVVIGSIEIAGAEVEEQAQWYRRLLGKLSKYLIRAVSGLWEIRDSQRGFKLFSRRGAQIIFPRQTITDWGFDFEALLIAKRHGFRIKEVPVRWVNPPDSKVRLGAYVTTLGELLQVKWNDIRGRYE